MAEAKWSWFEDEYRGWEVPQGIGSDFSNLGKGQK